MLVESRLLTAYYRKPTGSQSDQSLLAGHTCGLSAISCVEFVKDGANVVLDRALGQHQARGDLFIAQAVGKQAQHVALALAEWFIFGRAALAAIGATQSGELG